MPTLYDRQDVQIYVSEQLDAGEGILSRCMAIFMCPLHIIDRDSK